MNNLTDFYTQLFESHSVIKTIGRENRKKIETENSEEVVKEETLTNDAHILYLLSFIDILSNDYKDVIVEIFKTMQDYQFKSVASVSENDCKDTKRDDILQNNYDYYRKINLYDHTLNCACITVEMLHKQNTPAQTIFISLVISLLHDFGKSSLVSKDNMETKKERHHQISANFAKKFFQSFRKNKKKSFVTNDFIDLIVDVLRSHHNEIKIKNPFLNVLIDADMSARAKELEFLKTNIIKKVMK